MTELSPALLLPINYNWMISNGNFDFIYRKVSNLSEIKKIVSSFNKGSKIAHLIIMAHGLQDSMVLFFEKS